MDEYGALDIQKLSELVHDRSHREYIIQQYHHQEQQHEYTQEEEEEEAGCNSATGTNSNNNSTVHCNEPNNLPDICTPGYEPIQITCDAGVSIRRGVMYVYTHYIYIVCIYIGYCMYIHIIWILYVFI